jgi:transcriptional regulator with XRE-family HTH domain
MTAADVVRSARRRRRLGQRELGQRARVTQSQLSQIEGEKSAPLYETVERILRGAGHRLIAVPTVRDDAATITLRIREALEEGDHERALRLFIQLNDNLAAETPEIRFALSIAEPEPTGLKHWDAAIAGLIEFRLAEVGLPSPRWVDGSAKFLSHRWTFGERGFADSPDETRVPEPFLKRRVLIDRDTLASA